MSIIKRVQNRSTNPMDAICKLYVELSTIEETINPHSFFYSGKLMTRLAHEAASASAFEAQRIIPITDAMESFIQSINFSVLSETEQLHVLSYLSHMEHINHLEIHGCCMLDQPFLLHMLDKRGNLRQVTLIDCSKCQSKYYPHTQCKISTYNYQYREHR